MGLFNPMSSQHTSEILLHLGGKIMKNCLWPSGAISGNLSLCRAKKPAAMQDGLIDRWIASPADTSPGPSGRDDADKGEASMETEAQVLRSCLWAWLDRNVLGNNWKSSCRGAT